MNKSTRTPASSIVEAPAPWRLSGDAFICALHLPADRLANDPWLPKSLKGKRKPTRTALLMYVNYHSSDIGPYHELLFVPGVFPFADGRRHPCISRILVSTETSVVNGRKNWGIPKEMAAFSVNQEGRTLDVQVKQDDSLVAELTFRHWPVGLPTFGSLFPERWRTLGQHHDGKTFLYAPLASGLVQPARLINARFNPELFPDLNAARSLFAVRMPNFQMSFPEARVLDEI